ncbi:class I SAM-dependent methyltransferase [Caulobacter sp. UNC279MFTsu5.1]|uniref:class I SAM-dependent methyltransferase n=1 Tax=Caulobacter sp. UNC279MFTsu5.1 TaxID=1502775 RepID=UPI0008E2BAAA|nr:class I SAM-dependent methyltransferase [Caulobacter sp. UNC279MFTsu5.1]SFK16030.1 Methyltransferase domain-containing protein [Caulobacter sp. UNC279MFTsu5.1]
MANLSLPTPAAAVLAALVLAVLAAPRLLRHAVRLRRRRGGAARDRLWNLFYGLDWGEVATNNYGFAPADGDAPERHQLQMYAELLALLRARGGPGRTTDLLEVSCGRGGGLAHLARLWPSPLKAIGLDASEQAIAACRRLHGDVPGLTFVRGSALALPFPDGVFDVVVNVEASNDYGDFAGFFQEVCRVLRPGGVLLYCDTRRAEEAERVAATMRAAGLQGDWRDITEHVVAACRADTPRRLALIRRRAPWFLRLAFETDLRSYAAVEGSAKFEAFAARKRLYLMTCAVKPPLLLGAPVSRPAADVIAR